MSIFRDQHIVITGGSSGLGLELARRFADHGARLTLIARNANKLAQAAEELRRCQPSVSVTVEALDVSDEDATNQTMQRIAQANGGIDVLINNAGILREGHFEKLPTQAFRDVMEINYFGVLHATRAALPFLKATRGRLVNIASMAGLTGVFGYTPYCSAKHALVGLSESLRYELKPLGVRVHVVCPGEFDSPMVDEVERYRTPENRAHTLTIPKTTVTVIAADTLSGIRANKFMIIPGRMARIVNVAVRHLPGLARALGDNAVDRARNKG